MDMCVCCNVETTFAKWSMDKEVRTGIGIELTPHAICGYCGAEKEVEFMKKCETKNCQGHICLQCYGYMNLTKCEACIDDGKKLVPYTDPAADGVYKNLFDSNKNIRFDSILSDDDDDYKPDPKNISNLQWCDICQDADSKLTKCSSCTAVLCKKCIATYGETVNNKLYCSACFDEGQTHTDTCEYCLKIKKVIKCSKCCIESCEKCAKKHGNEFVNDKFMCAGCIDEGPPNDANNEQLEKLLTQNGVDSASRCELIKIFIKYKSEIRITNEAYSSFADFIDSMDYIYASAIEYYTNPIYLDKAEFVANEIDILLKKLDKITCTLSYDISPSAYGELVTVISECKNNNMLVSTNFDQIYSILYKYYNDELLNSAPIECPPVTKPKKNILDIDNIKENITQQNIDNVIDATKKILETRSQLLSKKPSQTKYDRSGGTPTNDQEVLNFIKNTTKTLSKLTATIEKLFTAVEGIESKFNDMDSSLLDVCKCVRELKSTIEYRDLL
jgi:hypothetical protein